MNVVPDNLVPPVETQTTAVNAVNGGRI
jgi:hypothetical protein